MARLVADKPGYRFVAWEDTAIVVWLEAPTVDATAQMYSFVTALAAERKASIYILVFIESLATMPDAQARKAMGESMAQTASITKEVVGVIEGEGFRAAAVRAVASGMQLFARKTAPMTSVATAEAAIDLLLRRRGSSSVLERAGLTNAVRLARTGA